MGKKFVVSGMPQAAKYDGWCEICGSIISQGEMLQIIRIGPREKDWCKAHSACISETQDGGDTNAGGLRIGWKTLGSGHYEGQRKYSISVNDKEIDRLGDKRATIEIVLFLERHPDAARAFVQGERDRNSSQA